MLSRILVAVAVIGAIGLTWPALAQSDGVNGPVGDEGVTQTTPFPDSDNNSNSVYNRVVEANGTIVETRRVTEADGTIRVYRRISALRVPLPKLNGNVAWAGWTNGAVGGAIGGRYINGTTPADNSPLPGGPWPLH